jgi:translation initiation factor IF-2
VDSLRREKDDARSVSAGFECGLKLERYEDIQIGDIVEVFKIEQVAKVLA